MVTDKRPEREQTDQSLRSERERADQALGGKTEADKVADVVVNRAREKADAVLGAARDRADAMLDVARDTEDRQERRTGGTAVPGPVATARKKADDALRGERADADEILDRERTEAAVALARLFPLERDNTDRYLLSERARSDHALSNRDDFLGIVSHDLRSLLGGIVMSAALIAERTTGAEDTADPAQREVARIQRYAARMNRLIGDLLDIASIDAGKLAMDPMTGDAATLITEAVETFEAAATAKGISLRAAVPPADPLRADFDHDRLLQVLANLITNAIKFTPSGGRIEVRGVPSPDGVELSVSDTGAGIPRGMLEAIFDRFWQAGHNDRRGLGLGLYISRCIVEAHHGRIWAESAQGEGSRLRFTLPASA